MARPRTNGATRTAKREASSVQRGPDGATLLRMYEAMLLTRLIDERGIKLQRQGRIRFFVPCMGQEAAQVAYAMALQDDDWIYPSYRDTGTILARGVPLTEYLAQLWGNGLDLSKGRQMPNHFAFADRRLVSISSPIGTQISQAVGTAMAMKRKGAKTVCAVSFGDGATSSNDFHAGMNFAGVYQAPCLFVCQNNHWAISLPVSEQTAQSDLASKADAYGFEGVKVDGNDAAAVYQATLAAAHRAREGGGPTLLEMVTYRIGAHSSSDDATKYRDAEEVEDWKSKDPIPRLCAVLEERGAWDAKRDAALRERLTKAVADAVDAVEKAPQIGVASMFDDVYGRVPPFLEEQRESLLDEVKERGGIGTGHGEFPL
ncbi:MAG: thiamine pyrophosphate-dependent dehydrogenase E1 component subunit alpha [Planctomycetes bacterium]|nr:thiamine pyrophosphate-dependent dehydrogenase E1 component subunit alpha [Planctomycetota bacterium]